ncbi:MAG: Flp pilus assembly complex ATPase component [Candidatus Pacebacteria bacterium]|nr:Flp pilus assembly complex ATPase component [Candidatus Paceibacterota bacterium]
MQQAAPPVPVPGTVSQPQSVADILVSKNLVTQEQINQVTLQQAGSGKTIPQLIQEKGLVSEEEITRAESELNNIPFITIAETGASPEALSMIQESVARRYNLLPFNYDKVAGLLSVAMADPLDMTAVDFVRQKTGLEIKPFYAPPSELERALTERYAQSLSTEVNQALEESTKARTTQEKVQDLSQLQGQVLRQAPVTKIIDTILSFAMKARSSDIHIEPQESRTRVRYRIDGILQEKLILPKTVHDAVVSRVKILSDLKIDEKRVPQDGRFNFVANGEEVDLRVSTLPTVHGEKVVMRLLKKNSTVPTLEELGLRGIALQHVRDAIKVPRGIILVTGPTGSGKTTTLYSVLHQVNTSKVNIVTLEDPVEYQMLGVNQVQTNPQAGLTFASGMRSFLRQDPNIIMVGEIRDNETAELAIQASLTGHLVFSTLHTNSAAGALPRLLDMKAEPFLLASSMTLTMGQRIVRKINPEYREEYKPEQPVLDDIKQVLGNYFDLWCKQNKRDPNNITLFRPKADRPPTEPDYKGRVGIFEVMPISEEIRKLILGRRPGGELERQAMAEGMMLMKQDGYIKVLNGETTIEEVLRVAEI